jgi:hypothetical protein
MKSIWKKSLAWSGGLILLVGIYGCCSTKAQPDSVASYQTAMRETRPGALKRGSPEEKEAIARFESYLSVMNETTVKAGTRSVYAENAYLNDTLKTLHGEAAIEEYFLGSAANCESLTVRFDDVAESNGEYYFRWVMDVKFKKFKKGQTITTIGMTHIRFDESGKVILHQDYWDSAAGLYEHIPILGTMIRKIKSRL